MNYEIFGGLPYPLGANYDGNGVNFALFSANAERVQVCLFNKNEHGEVRIDLRKDYGTIAVNVRSYKKL